jgi:hypothetical protein
MHYDAESLGPTGQMEFWRRENPLQILSIPAKHPSGPSHLKGSSIILASHSEPLGMEVALHSQGER